MKGILSHFVGDYLLQSHWTATFRFGYPRGF